MAIEVTIKESLPSYILCDILGNENKKINQPVVKYHKTSESQTDEEARVALQLMIENDEPAI